MTGGANGGGSVDPATLNTKFNSSGVALPFSSDVSAGVYAVGDRCTYNGVLYECVVAKSTASSTTPDNDIYNATTATTNHWKVVSVQEAKLDAGVAAPQFDATKSYAVNEYVTYNGALYRCTTNHSAGAWNPSDFTATNMTSPDATLDVTSQGALRIVSESGEVLWQQGYNLNTTSSTSAAITLDNEAVNYYKSLANASGEVEITFPSQVTTPAKVSDFLLDVSRPMVKAYGSTVSAYDDTGTTTYDVGNVAVYNGKVYSCNTASTTGTWDPTKWNYVADYIIEYDSTATYAVGDRVLHDDTNSVKMIYSCNTASTTGTWDATKWDLVGQYVPLFSSTETYNTGDNVIYNNAIYQCEADNTTGDWAAANWSMQNLLLSLGTALDNTMSVIVSEGSDLPTMFAIGLGEMSEFYFTLTAFQVNGLPTYKVVKQVVENGGAE